MKGKGVFLLLGAVSFLLAIASIPALTACLGSTPSPTATSVQDIRIGVLLPLAGKDSASGKSLRNALELALAMENSEIDGYPVKMIIEDEGSGDPAVALEKAQKLVQSDKVDLILGPHNRESALAVLNYTSSLPMVNLKWTEAISNKSELGNQYAFWTTPMYQDDTYPLGLYVYNQGIDRVTILGTRDADALDFVEGFKNAFELNDGKILQEQWALPEETDYSRYLSALMAGAEALVCATLGDAAKANLFGQYFETGLQARMPVILAETGTLSSSALESLGDRIIGVVGVERYLPDSTHPENTRFRAAHKQKYGAEPPDKSVEAYNCMRVILAALKATHGDTAPDVLKSALLKLEIELPTGTFIFSDGRVGVRTIYIRQVVKENDQLRWKILREYSMMRTHQQTYP